MEYHIRKKREAKRWWFDLTGVGFISLADHSSTQKGKPTLVSLPERDNHVHCSDTKVSSIATSLQPTYRNGC